MSTPAVRRSATWPGISWASPLKRIPSRSAGSWPEQFEEALLPVQVVPVAGGEHIRAEGIEDVDQRLAPREQRLGAALDGVAGVDQQGVGPLGAEPCDEGGHSGEPTFQLAGSVAADVRAGNQMPVQVADMDETDLCHGTTVQQTAQAMP